MLFKVEKLNMLFSQEIRKRKASQCFRNHMTNLTLQFVLTQ